MLFIVKDKYDGNGCFIIKVNDDLVTKLTTSSKKTIDDEIGEEDNPSCSGVFHYT